ncbi:hypothetical protein [Kribbella albertanoniae]|uniref:Uncharacterized protein n=1 Tax=Kribbella albertanoniae TaxID=1266829 RepID=A0A4R4QJM1_9ACTN|nr:hypothetical protein [Kribbella albertanoniae]TDC35860.1 hypothetical protein E1261_00610 [Kribbella albertanoniae]
MPSLLHPVTFIGLPAYQKFARQLHQRAPGTVGSPIVAGGLGQLAEAICTSDAVLLTGHGYSPTSWGDDSPWPYGDAAWYIGARNWGFGTTLPALAAALHAAGGITAQLLILDACESGSTAVVDTFRNLMTRPDHVLIVAADGYIDWTAGERAIHNLVDLANTGIPAIEAARALPNSAPYCVA